MSGVGDCREPEPKLAWIWGTEQIKNCVNGKHEPQTGLDVRYRVSDYRQEQYRELPVKVCKHCNTLYPEQS